MKTATETKVAEAYARGHRDGHALGSTAGFEQGIVDGVALERERVAKQQREEAAALRLAEEALALERGRWLVGDTSLGISEQVAKEIRDDVTSRVVPGPEPDQWKMILSNVPATYVVAGAGSGKSATLVLRVIALHLYMGIPRRNISVFTFTRASREDFVDKLRKRFEQWGIELGEMQARSVVRTFHSMVYKMAREVLGHDVRVLELLDRQRRGDVPDTEVDNLLEVGSDGRVDAVATERAPDGPYADADVLPTRVHLLRLAYERALSESAEFRKLIGKIQLANLRRGARQEDGKTQSNIKWIVTSDESVTRTIEARWRETVAPGLWPLPAVEPVSLPLQVSARYGERFHANGYLAAIGAYVFLGGADHFRADAWEAFPQWINTKRKVLSTISDKPILWIDTVEQLRALAEAIEWCDGALDQRAKAPMFDLVPPREMKPVLITEALFSHAQFVESLGLSVADSLKSAVTVEDTALPDLEAWFNQAVALYWPHLEAVLKAEGIWTFNQLFERFSEQHPENLIAIGTPTLAAMEHLMIDEFQDISPQIVQWIRGCKRELVRRSRGGSLMCVGDDWQSIYGWRGSSPDYFLHFKSHFPAASHLKIKLEDNFRSSDRILRCAESVLAGVDGMEQKTCRAKGMWANETTPVLLHEVDGDFPINAIRQLIRSEVARSCATTKEPMLVLARGGARLGELREGLRGLPVKFMTVHSAKGLESRSVVMLDDCVYTGTNPVRNYLYRLAGLGSYDVAQRAESRRLAYVAITRAMERCYWFAKPRPDGAFERIPRGRAFARSVALDEIIPSDRPLAGPADTSF